MDLFEHFLSLGRSFVDRQPILALALDLDDFEFNLKAMAKLCKQRLQEFNTAGQASKIKHVLTTAQMAMRYTKGELDPKVA